MVVTHAVSGSEAGEGQSKREHGVSEGLSGRATLGRRLERREGIRKEDVRDRSLPGGGASQRGGPGRASGPGAASKAFREACETGSGP